MRHLLLSLLLLAGADALAQAPLHFSFQAVVRDANDELLADTPVGLRISILQGSINGAAVYVETHSTSTNMNGLVSLQVGGGTVQSGSLATIDWGNGPYFIKSETDPNGGTNYTIAGTQQMMSVPYALFAANAGSGSGEFVSAGGVVRNTSHVGTDHFVFGSTSLDDISGTDDDSRFFFNKAKGAFRAGQVTGSSQWNDANIGSWSFAAGFNPLASGSASTALGSYATASGNNSVAFGYQATATGDYSTAMGRFTTASGQYSTSMGRQTTASGENSTAAGFRTTAPSLTETAIGQFNTDYTPGTNGATQWNATDRLFTIGNGTSNAIRSDALVVLKNGNTGIGTDQPTSALDIDGEVRIRGGSPGAGKVLTSAADGSATWQMAPVFLGVSQSEFISCTEPPCVINHTIMATCPAGYTRVQVIDLQVQALGWDPDNTEMKVILPPDDRRTMGVNFEFTIPLVDVNRLVRLKVICASGFPIPN